ncbi:DUF418 domain-containing protein, partial [Nocardia gipuzkoensis]
GPAGQLGIAVAVFAAQLAVSALWLRWWRYGPAEWVLRWITLGHPPALRADAGIARNELSVRRIRAADPVPKVEVDDMPTG